ncbi:uncharacterized protein BDV17DRAFT_248687, partial [Aspergillus undulatus]|uniref:uncharacterized protein n=1 Tax=Aspergillus undulatus TaxID=1810928 RepID=UPI003CCD672B
MMNTRDITSLRARPFCKRMVCAMFLDILLQQAANALRAIHNDPDLYVRLDEFFPERYEQSTLGFKPDVKEATDGIPSNCFWH